MNGKHRIFLLGIRAGSDVEEVRKYISRRFGISDELRLKTLLYDTPSILGEVDTLQAAETIKEELDSLRVAAEIKRPVVRPPAPRPSQGPAKVVQKPCEDRPFSSRLVSFLLLVIFFSLVSLVVIKYLKKTSEDKVAEDIAKPREIVLKEDSDPVTLIDVDGPETPFASTEISVEKTGIPATDDASPALLKTAYAFIEKGEYKKAWEVFQEYLYDYPDNEKAIKGLKYVGFKLANAAFDADKIDEAIDYMKAVEGYLPADHQVMAQLGVFHYAKKDYYGAERYLERARNLDTDIPDVYLLLAKILYYHGDDMQKAQWYLQKALELDPGRDDIRAFMVKIANEQSVEGSFFQTDSAHFIVKYEGIADRHAARTVLGILDDAWSDIGWDLGEYPSKPTVVILYTGEQFQQVTRAPHWVGGLFDGRIRLPVAGLPNEELGPLRRLLYHEYTHVIIHRITNGKCPVWIHEGLAQHMQVRAGAEQDPWLQPSVIYDSGRIPLLASLQAPFVNLNAQDAKVAYVTSYYAMQYFLDTYGLSYARSLLRELGEGKSFAEALKNATGTDLKDFERRFHTYLDEKVGGY